MASARLLPVRDAVAAAIAAVAGSDATVAACYRFDVPDGAFARQVFVYPVGREQAEMLDRGEDLHDYRIGATIVERYDGDGEPPVAWMDERVAWVESTVYAILEDPRSVALLGSLWPQQAGITLAYDLEALEHFKLFWADCEFTFREAEDVDEEDDE